MDVNAIAQAAQTQQQPAAQDSGGGSVADMFAALLKHQFGSKVAGHQLLNGQAAIDMVGSIQNSAPQAVLNTPAQALTQQSAPQAKTQSTGPGNTGNGPASNQTVTAANNNTSRNSGNGPQSNTAGSQNQQGPAAQNTSNGPAAQTSGPAAQTQVAAKTGEDQATEETAAVMAAATYIVQQQTAPVQAVQAIAAAATNGPAVGPQQQNAGPAAGPAAAQAAQQLAAAAEDDVAPDSTHAWNANFLNNGPATPEIAQQAASLAKVTGPSGANISVQTTTGDTVAAPSTSTLVPDAVMAIPGFFTGHQGGASTGGGTGDQQNGQQTNDNAPQAVIDPAAQALAQDLQALSAISALLQGAAQSAVAATQSAGANVAAVSSASSATEAALPQAMQAPTQPNTAAPANFAQKMQEAEEPEEPQAPKQTTLPSAIDQIKMEIEKGVASGSSTIKVQLNPDNMGRVDVKLEVQNGSVKATISADHPETLALLKNDQAGLVHALQDAGLNADSNSLSFFLRGDQQRQFAQSGRQGGRDQQDGGAAGIDAISTVSGASAAAGASAASSALDISV